VEWLVTDARRGAVARIDDWDSQNVDWLPLDQPAQPSGLAVLSDGTIIAADALNHLLAAWDGSGWSTFGTQGSGQGEFSRPLGLEVDRFDRIHVADAGNRRVVRIDDMGGASWAEYGHAILSPAHLTTPGGFAEPAGVTVTDEDWVHVADLRAGRLASMSSMDGADWTTQPVGGPAAVAAEPGRAELGMAVLGAATAALVDPSAGEVAATARGVVGAPVAVTWAEGELVCCDSFGSRLVRLERVGGELRPASEWRLESLGIRRPTAVRAI
jgi:hypothetical protein